LSTKRRKEKHLEDAAPEKRKTPQGTLPQELRHTKAFASTLSLSGGLGHTALLGKTKLSGFASFVKESMANRGQCKDCRKCPLRRV
jgi:hypothetical protein